MPSSWLSKKQPLLPPNHGFLHCATMPKTIVRTNDQGGGSNFSPFALMFLLPPNQRAVYLSMAFPALIFLVFFEGEFLVKMHKSCPNAKKLLFPKANISKPKNLLFIIDPQTQKPSNAQTRPVTETAIRIFNLFQY